MTKSVADHKQLNIFDFIEVDKPKVIGYSSKIAEKVCNISFRQLDHWTRTGLIGPSINDALGSGNKRLFSLNDLVKIKTIKKLRDSGVSLQMIRNVIEKLQARKLEFDKIYLFSDGTEVYFSEEPSDILHSVSSGQGIFALSLASVLKETNDDIKKLPVMISNQFISQKLKLRTG